MLRWGQWLLCGRSGFANLVLRILFAAHPELLGPVQRIIHQVIATFLIKQAGLKRNVADTSAVDRLGLQS
jgi:hypothetical protein